MSRPEKTSCSRRHPAAAASAFSSSHSFYVSFIWAEIKFISFRLLLQLILLLPDNFAIHFQAELRMNGRGLQLQRMNDYAAFSLSYLRRRVWTDSSWVVKLSHWLASTDVTRNNQLYTIEDLPQVQECTIIVHCQDFRSVKMILTSFIGWYS